MSLLRRYLPLATSAIAITSFYLYKVGGVGLLGPDEPRYAAISQSMARSRDFLTPTLWGAPWFEKPPLLYWLSGAAFAANIPAELAARLPVLLLSLAFLALAAWLLAREFSPETAAVSVSLLATSAGWVAYSGLGLTDLPLAVFFSLAIILALPLLRRQPQTARLALRFAAVGACLGIAALAKSLVPVALALPLLWFLRRWWRTWWIAIGACLAIAGPWYLAMYLRHGPPFIDELFLKHQFARLYSDTLQHIQPWYFYIPVLLAALFPWTTLLALFARRTGATPWDDRRRLLFTIVFFGFVFFSLSRNKLPGYLLPLLPSLFILIGAEFEHRPFAQLSRPWLLPSACLIALIPLIAKGLPGALAAGRISGFHLAHLSATEIFYVAAPLAALFFGRRSWIGPLLVLCVAAGGIVLKTTAYPAIDQTVSARGLWHELKQQNLRLCDGGMNRDWNYGLSFYRNEPLPPCGSGQTYDRELRAKGRSRPSLESNPPSAY